MRDFAAIAQPYQEEIARCASELIQFPSHSTHEQDMAKYVEQKMRDLGYDKVEVDRYGNVFGTVKGTGGGSSVLLNCHMDVVDEGDPAKWKYPPFGGVMAEGRIWGRGASDTKGTMAIQIYAPIILKRAGLTPKGDMVCACVVCEENAGFGSMMHTRDGTYLTDYAILGEASENNLAIGSRGRFCAVITIHGKACHASIPHEGKNPFDFLAELLPRLKQVELGSDELFGSSTMSVTKIVSSEPGTNVIPNDVVVYVDFRSCSTDTEEVALGKIQAAIDSVPLEGYTVDLRALYFPLTTYTGFEGEGYQGEAPFAVSPDEPYVAECRQVLEELTGHEIKTYPWAFATDAGHYASKGVKCLGYSPAEIRFCHTTLDQVELKAMEESVAGHLALLDLLANKEK